VVPAWSSAHSFSCSRPYSPHSGRNSTYRLVQFCRATSLSENDAVRDFAQTMIRDHTAVNDAAGTLIAELNVTPQDNNLSRALVAGAADKRAELSGLSGISFDCAYATNELGYHQIVNQTIAETFLPVVTVAPLKDLLTDALATFKQHEGHAESMVAGLQCAS
jgi:putative membrane protein